MSAVIDGAVGPSLTCMPLGVPRVYREARPACFRACVRARVYSRRCAGAPVHGPQLADQLSFSVCDRDDEGLSVTMNAIREVNILDKPDNVGRSGVPWQQ